MSKHEINVDWKETAERLLQSNRELEKLLADDPVRAAFDKVCPTAHGAEIVFEGASSSAYFEHRIVGPDRSVRHLTMTFKVYLK